MNHILPDKVSHFSKLILYELVRLVRIQLGLRVSESFADDFPFA